MTDGRTSPLRVTIADDEPLVMSGLRMVLEIEPGIEVVDEATDGQAAWEVIAARRPDIALVDISMPRLTGIEVARRVAADPSLRTTKVVMLTTFADDAYLLDAVRAGASGYLLKSMAPAQIRSSLHAVARGETSIAPSIVGRLLAEYTSRRVARDPRLQRLTEREAAVLREIARGRSNVEIANVLYVSEGTVKTHVASILRKLELRDRTQAAVAAYELGLVRAGEPA
jgi:DNA-binding NarL/FixJ family response regulator